MTKREKTKPNSTLLTALALWLIRWTALLGGFGLASLYLQLSWLWVIGVCAAIADLTITLLNEARLAERRNRSRELISEIEDISRDTGADETTK